MVLIVLLSAYFLLRSFQIRKGIVFQDLSISSSGIKIYINQIIEKY